MCSPPMIKMTCGNLGFAHTSSLPLLYNGWSAVMIVCFWPTWFQISTKRLITVSVSLSSAGAWRIGSIPAGVIIGGSTVLVASLSAPQGGTDRSSPSLCIRDTIEPITLAVLSAFPHSSLNRTTRSRSCCRHRMKAPVSFPMANGRDQVFGTPVEHLV